MDAYVEAGPRHRAGELADRARRHPPVGVIGDGVAAGRGRGHCVGAHAAAGARVGEVAHPGLPLDAPDAVIGGDRRVVARRQPVGRVVPVGVGLLRRGLQSVDAAGGEVPDPVEGVGLLVECGALDRGPRQGRVQEVGVRVVLRHRSTDPSG